MSKQIICRPERENPQGRNAVYVASPFAVEPKRIGRSCRRTGAAVSDSPKISKQMAQAMRPTALLSDLRNYVVVPYPYKHATRDPVQ